MVEATLDPAMGKIVSKVVTLELRPGWQGHSQVKIWENHIPGPKTEMRLTFTTKENKRGLVGLEFGGQWERGGERIWGKVSELLWRQGMRLGDQIVHFLYSWKLHASQEVCLLQQCFHCWQILGSSGIERWGWMTHSRESTRVDELSWTFKISTLVIPKRPRCFRNLGFLYKWLMILTLILHTYKFTDMEKKLLVADFQDY